jgi:hypothetical protein
MSGLLDKARLLGKAYAASAAGSGTSSQTDAYQLEAELLDELMNVITRIMPDDAAPIELVPSSRPNGDEPQNMPRVSLGRRPSRLPGKPTEPVLIADMDEIAPMSLSSVEMMAGFKATRPRSTLGAAIPILEHFRSNLLVRGDSRSTATVAAIAEVDAVLEAIREGERAPASSPG